MTLGLDGVVGGLAVTGREELWCVWCEVEGRILPVFSRSVS